MIKEKLSPLPYFRRRTVDRASWVDEATIRFGYVRSNWKFVCPMCGQIHMVGDYKDTGIGVAEKCLANNGKPCISLNKKDQDRFNPVEIKLGCGSDYSVRSVKVFEFLKENMVDDRYGRVSVSVETKFL